MNTESSPNAHAQTGATPFVVDDDVLNYLYTHLNPEVWRPTTPRHVHRVCAQIAKETGKHARGLVNTWEAIKDLIVLKGQNQAYGALGMREIARESGVSATSLSGADGYIQALVDHGLIEVIDPQRGVRNVYFVNLFELEKKSIEELEAIYRERSIRPPRPVERLVEQTCFLDELGGTAAPPGRTPVGAGHTPLSGLGFSNFDR